MFMYNVVYQRRETRAARYAAQTDHRASYPTVQRFIPINRGTARHADLGAGHFRFLILDLHDTHSASHYAPLTQPVYIITIVRIFRKNSQRPPEPWIRCCLLIPCLFSRLSLLQCGLLRRSPGVAPPPLRCGAQASCGLRTFAPKYVSGIAPCRCAGKFVVSCPVHHTCRRPAAGSWSSLPWRYGWMHMWMCAI